MTLYVIRVDCCEVLHEKIMKRKHEKEDERTNEYRGSSNLHIVVERVRKAAAVVF